MNSRAKHRREDSQTPFLARQPAQGEPISAADLVNRYGTYEVQATADSENLYPAIAPGKLDSAALSRLRRQTAPGVREDGGTF